MMSSMVPKFVFVIIVIIGLGFQQIFASPLDRAVSPYTRDAIQQAQSSLLIPRDAEIQKVDQGIEVRSVEGIPVDQRIDLEDLLGNVAPREVIENLQKQIDGIH